MISPTGELIEFLTYLDPEPNARILGFMKVYGYFDASGHHDGVDGRGNESPAVVVAGFLATPLKWQQFDKKWRKMLSNAGVPYFHATELVNKKGAYKDWTTEQVHAFIGQALSIINSSVLYGVSMALILNDYVRVLEEHPVIPHILRSPYVFCTYRCWETGVDWARKTKYDESIKYIFESGDDYQHEILKAHAVASGHTEAQILRFSDVGGLTFVDGVENTPLQAADFLAYSIYKETYRRRYTPNEPQRPTAQTFLLMPGEHKYYVEEHLRGYIEDAVKDYEDEESELDG